MSWYPKEVYGINETVTRENMRKYDEYVLAKAKMEIQ